MQGVKDEVKAGAVKTDKPIQQMIEQVCEVCFTVVRYEEQSGHCIKCRCGHLNSCMG